MTNQHKMSPMEHFAKEFIEHVGCISLWQLNYILYRLYGAKPPIVEYMVSSFEGRGYCHFDKDRKYIGAGKSFKSKIHKLDRKTIMAIAVALATIENPEDYRTIYAPFYGENLRFMNDDKAYAVFVCDEDNAASLQFYQKQYEDYSKRMEKKFKSVGLDETADYYQTLLITYPLKADKQTALKVVSALELSMPHQLCFLSGNNIYEEMVVRTINPQAK